VRVQVGVEELVHLRRGEGSIGAKIQARNLAAITRDIRAQRALPVIDAVNFAGPQRAPLQTAVMVEYE